MKNSILTIGVLAMVMVLTSFTTVEKSKAKTAKVTLNKEIAKLNLGGSNGSNGAIREGFKVD